MGEVQLWRNRELIITIPDVPVDDQMSGIEKAITALGLRHRVASTIGASADEVADLAPGLADIKWELGAARKMADYDDGRSVAVWVPVRGE